MGLELGSTPIYRTMIAKEFTEKMRLIAPNPEALLVQGLRESYVMDLIASFKAEPKGTYRDNGDELLNLIHNYDASKIEIALVHFDLDDDSPYGIPPSERFLRVGYAEADFVVIDKTTGEIALEDHESSGFIMLYCAENGGKFLDALYEMAKPNDEYLVDPKDQGSVDWCKKADVCAHLAGGDKYLDFYKMALGCDT